MTRINAKNVISIAGAVCPPETDRVFNKWFDEELILIKSFRELLGITRYQLVRAADSAGARVYPQYLSIYRFADLSAIDTWQASLELAESSQSWQETGARAGVRILWNAQYESVQTWQNTRPHSVVTIVGIQCPPATESEFDTWYSLKHIPQLLKFRWLLGATNCKLCASGPAQKTLSATPLTEYPNNLTFYHFDSTRAADVFDTSPEYLSAHDDWLNVAKRTSASVRWRAQYEPTKTWQR